MPDSDNDSGGPSNAGGELSSPREQDRFLPIANVSRIMKKALPANAKISKDAKETVQECVSEFISFVARASEFTPPRATWIGDGGQPSSKQRIPMCGRLKD